MAQDRHPIDNVAGAPVGAALLTYSATYHRLVNEEHVEALWQLFVETGLPEAYELERFAAARQRV